MLARTRVSGRWASSRSARRCCDRRRVRQRFEVRRQGRRCRAIGDDAGCHTTASSDTSVATGRRPTPRSRRPRPAPTPPTRRPPRPRPPTPRPPTPRPPTPRPPRPPRKRRTTTTVAAAFTRDGSRSIPSTRTLRPRGREQLDGRRLARVGARRTDARRRLNADALVGSPRHRHRLALDGAPIVPEPSRRPWHPRCFGDRLSCGRHAGEADALSALASGVEVRVEGIDRLPSRV